MSKTCGDRGFNFTHLARTNTNLLKQKKVFTRVNVAVNLSKAWQFYRIVTKLVKHKTEMPFGVVCLLQTSKHSQ